MNTNQAKLYRKVLDAKADGFSIIAVNPEDIISLFKKVLHYEQILADLSREIDNANKRMNENKDG